MKELLLITFLAAILVSTGCSSVDARNKGTQSSLYPGVKAGLDGSSGSSGTAAQALDLPFSFILDTVLLPIDLLRSGSKGENDKSAEPEAAPKP
jgi:uncharacterized protein YceK